MSKFKKIVQPSAWNKKQETKDLEFILVYDGHNNQRAEKPRILDF